MAVNEFEKAEYYTNRECSWLGFNSRVLNEARDKTLPMLERLKFLSITSSNLDEFFMIRVASLKDMVHAKYTKKDIAGMTPQEQLEVIAQKAHELVQQQYSTYNRSLLPIMKQNGLEVVTEHEKMTKEQKAFADKYFEENVYPVLTPMAMDSSRPFPLIRNKTLNIGALISKKGEKGKAEFATVQVPSVLPRIVRLPDGPNGEKCLTLLEEIIERNIDKLFLNYDVVCAHPYRIMRNADLTIDEDDAADLLHVVALVPGRGEKAPLDPVLNGVGFQSGDACHLTERQTTRQKQRLKQAISPVRIAAQPFQCGARNVPVCLHRIYPPSFELRIHKYVLPCDVLIVSHGHMIVNSNL